MKSNQTKIITTITMMALVGIMMMTTTQSVKAAPFDEYKAGYVNGIRVANTTFKTHSNTVVLRNNTSESGIFTTQGYHASCHNTMNYCLGYISGYSDEYKHLIKQRMP